MCNGECSLTNSLILTAHIYLLSGSIYTICVHLQVVKVRPSDRDAKAKYTECNKIVKMNAFAKAIAVNDSKTIAETLDLSTMCKISVCSTLMLGY